MSAHDFILQITPVGGADYAVHVESPAGECRSSFRLPFPPDQWRALGHLRGCIGDAHPPDHRDISQAKTMGAKLYRALFTDSVKDLYAESRGIRANADAGLVIKLKLGTDRTPAERMPWELLYRADTRDFLGLNPRTPIVRHIELQRPTRRFALPESLKILAVASSPRDLPALDLAKERRQIEASCQGNKAVELRFLNSATLQGLQQAMAEGHFQCIHFMGHGSFDEKTGTGSIALEDMDGYAHFVDGEILATQLKASGDLSLVCLSACETAAEPRQPEHDDFLGTAKALVLAGIPYVLAMQFPITDAAAITFSTTLYHRLAHGDGIEKAVTHGRIAIHAESPDTVAWATPILFARNLTTSYPDPKHETPSKKNKMMIKNTGNIHNTQIAGRDIKTFGR